MRFRCALAITVALTACDRPPGDEAGAGRTAAPLIGGGLHGGDPGAVALLSSPNGGAGPEVFCSGTLVSPRVVLTAAHCIDQAGASPDITVAFGAHAYDDSTRIGVARAATHPGWSGELEDNNDVGVLLLAFPSDPSWAVPLGLDPITQGDLGRPVRRVGFGRHDPDQPKPDGAKRAGDTTITYVASSMDWFFAGDDDLIPCSGDSGGPVLGWHLDGVERLIGVHSFGFGCESSSAGAVRVDLHAESFVLPWIEENDPSCGADNLCAPVGCAADPDCQPCGPEGTCVADCPRPDLDCRTQEVGEICQADSQCTSDLCVYWQAEPSTHFCSSPCDGDGDCPAGMSCQQVEPFGRVCYHDGEPPGLLGSSCEEHGECGSYICADGQCVVRCDLSAGQACPAGFDCARHEADATYYCVAAPDGGSCQAAGPQAPAGLLPLGLLLLLAHVLRRRTRAG